MEDRTRRFDGIVGKVIDRWNFALNQFDGGLHFDGFIKLIGADRVGEYIRPPPYPHLPQTLLTFLERRGVSPERYADVPLDEEGLALKAQLKQLHRWSWPLREISSLIDTQQRTLTGKDKPREEWRTYQINRWPGHVHTFVPGVFRVIACLQRFCNPEKQGAMPFGLQGVGNSVDMSGWDEAAGNPSASEDEATTTTKTVQTLIHRLQKNVRVTRDHAYPPYSKR